MHGQHHPKGGVNGFELFAGQCECQVVGALAAEAPGQAQAQQPGARQSLAHAKRRTRDAVTRGAWHTVTVLEASLSGFARGLFDALHATDDRGCDVIVVDAVPDGDAWEAVRDRLARATA